MIKKILLIALFIITISVVYLYYRINSNINILPQTCLFIVDEQKTSDEHKILHLILFRYFPKTNKLNVLFINDNITIVQKKIKSRTLNESYYLQKENKIEFIKGEIGKIFTDSFKIDKYINLDISHFNTFTNLFETDLSLSEFKDNLFYNEDYLIEMIYNIKFIKNIINKMNMVTFFKIVKLLKENKGFVKTDIQPINISSLKIYFALKRIKDICFIDISTVEKRKRTEINEDLVIKMRELFSYENYYRENKENVRLKVLNASKKQRMAIKAVDKLRNNSFDVFEWGSYDKTYEYTIIVDLFGDMGIPAKIVDILKCGEVLHRFENKPFEDVTVILGKDCTIYDKLDRKNQ